MTTSRTDNRARFPDTARVVDLLRAAFGDDQVRVNYCSNGTDSVGTSWGYTWPNAAPPADASAAIFAAPYRGSFASTKGRLRVGTAKKR